MSKKILIITPGFAENEQDTSCIPALQELVLSLSAISDFELKIIALHFPQKKRYTWHNIAVESLGKNNPKRLRKALALKDFSSFLRKEIAEFNPDLLHGFWLTDAGYITALEAKRKKLPAVVTAMGQDVSPKFYTKRIRNWKTPVVAISEYQKKHLQKMGIEPVQVIAHGLPSITANGTSKKYDIVVVGSLITVKNPLFALTCLRTLIEKQPQLKAAFIGDGPLKESALRFAQENGLTNQLEFLGHLSREKTLQQMKNAQILLHTAQFEGFGLVLIEALALGLHVVSTPVGIAPELNPVYLFNTENECVAQLEKALKTTARATLPYPIETTAKHYQELYLRLLNA